MCTTLLADEMFMSFQPLKSSSREETIDGKKYSCKPIVPVNPSKAKKKRRVKKPVAPKEVIVEKEVIKEVLVVKEVQIDNSNKNRVKGYVSIAPGYINSYRVGDIVTLEPKLGFVPGIGYERQLNKLWSIEGIYLFNRSVILGVGYSF